MEDYFELRMWYDFYVPLILIIALAVVFLFLGVCKIVIHWRNKINERRNKIFKEGEK